MRSRKNDLEHLIRFTIKRCMPVYFRILLFLLLSQTLNGQYTLNDIVSEYEAFEETKSKKLRNQWPDLNQAYYKSEIALYSKWISNLKKIDKSAIQESDLINYEMLLFILEDKLYALNSESYLFPLSSEGGFIIGMMYSTRGMLLRDSTRRANYISKVLDTPRYIDDQISALKRGLKSGKTVPKLVVKNCIEILNDLMGLEGSKFFLFKPLVGYNELNFEDKAHVMNAFIKLKEFLENDYLENTRTKIGIRENSNGKEYYEQRVRFFTTFNMTPQEVFDVGQSEVARIKAEMLEIISQLEFEGDFDAFLEFLRTDKQFYTETPDELLMHAAWFSKKAEEILPKYFGHLPRLPFTVSPVPASIAPNYTTGRYSGGSMKDYKPGAYWVNTYNLPARPLYVLPALTLHEAVPGHHLQISLANELKDSLPAFRSFYLSAYGEGWGLYSEYLGKEAGIYTTLYEDFGRLTYEMWRACRLVVDPGMHYFGWTRDEAVAFMKKNTALSLHEINTEINRYIGWPAQAVSYKIGELKIRELRKKSENELGELFDIRSFHDLILMNGSIPLQTLERIVDNYIKQTKEDVEKN